MRALDRKLLRDVVHLKGQVIAVALVVACGIAALLTLRIAYNSLLAARASYYRDYRFAEVFAHLERAPNEPRRASPQFPASRRSRRESFAK
jgi:putative ABC transport system permease protein